MEEGHFGIAKILSLGVEGLRSINPLFPGCIENGCVQLWFHCGFAEAQAFVSSPPFADIRWFQAGSGTSLWTRIAVTEQDFNARSPAVGLKASFLNCFWASFLVAFRASKSHCFWASYLDCPALAGFAICGGHPTLLW